MGYSRLRDDEKPFLDHYEDSVDNGSRDGNVEETTRLKRAFAGTALQRSIAIMLILTTTFSLAMNAWMLSLLKEFPRTANQQPEQEHSVSAIDFPYSPADEVLQFEIANIGTEDSNDIYIGPPSNVSDHAWRDLLAPTAIKVTAEEMRKANRQSVRVHNENEEIYIGALEVYHQLHCVKRMIQNRWPERYPQIAALGAFSDTHFNHCIQVLRKGIMCAADDSIDTWTYNATGDPVLHIAPRKCANWDALHEWANSRTLGAFRKVDVYRPDEEGWYGPL